MPKDPGGGLCRRGPAPPPRFFTRFRLRARVVPRRPAPRQAALRRDRPLAQNDSLGLRAWGLRRTIRDALSPSTRPLPHALPAGARQDVSKTQSRTTSRTIVGPETSSPARPHEALSSARDSLPLLTPKATSPRSVPRGCPLRQCWDPRNLSTTLAVVPTLSKTAPRRGRCRRPADRGARLTPEATSPRRASRGCSRPTAASNLYRSTACNSPGNLRRWHARRRSGHRPAIRGERLTPEPDLTTSSPLRGRRPRGREGFVARAARRGQMARPRARWPRIVGRSRSPEATLRQGEGARPSPCSAPGAAAECISLRPCGPREADRAKGVPLGAV